MKDILDDAMITIEEQQKYIITAFVKGQKLRKEGYVDADISTEYAYKDESTGELVICADVRGDRVELYRVPRGKWYFTS